MSNFMKLDEESQISFDNSSNESKENVNLFSIEDSVYEPPKISKLSKFLLSVGLFAPETMVKKKKLFLSLFILLSLYKDGHFYEFCFILWNVYSKAHLFYQQKKSKIN